MPAAARKPIVLICDDDESVRRAYQVILSHAYQLRFVVNGLEALELLKTFMPDLMFLDLKMPKRHGLEILKDIKRDRPSVPVIVVSGYHSAEVAQDALRYGAVDYLPKPFDPRQILAAVAAALPQT